MEGYPTAHRCSYRFGHHQQFLMEFWSILQLFDIPPTISRCIFRFSEPRCTKYDCIIGDDDYSVSNNVDYLLCFTLYVLDGLLECI